MSSDNSWKVEECDFNNNLNLFHSEDEIDVEETPKELQNILEHHEMIKEKVS